MEHFPDPEKDDFMTGGCALMCGAACCHLHWLVALFKRGDLRSKFGIKGDGCTDCLASYFCFPCTLAQMETEMKDRAALLQHTNGKADGYSQQSQGMVYGPSPQGHQPQYQNGHKY